MNNTSKKVIINVGNMSSMSSIYYNISQYLEPFNNFWKEGVVPDVEWNLMDLQEGKINISAIVFFLSIAKRMRSFTNNPHKFHIDWRPNILGFLSDINFFTVADSYNIFQWPETIGGYPSEKINPNTVLASFDAIMPIPDYSDKACLDLWKRHHRESYRQVIIKLCNSLFLEKDNINTELQLLLSRVCSEIVTNSLLWGKETAFVGLQRSSKLISISISDLGIGIKNSLILKQQNSAYTTNDLNSILVASTINQFDFGLKRAINGVIKIGGDISINSNSTEVLWCKDNWNTFLSNIEKYTLFAALKNFPPPVEKTTPSDKQNGFSRVWHSAIRGTRINFTIPLQ